DKLVGDEVMALYLPQLLSDGFEDDMLRDATELVGSAGPALGVGLDVGTAYVGNVGAGDVKDFTALGDVVNTASRLQSAAEGGQIVLSERLFGRLTDGPPEARATSLTLKGKSEAEPARVIYGSR
ncbi:MAG: adenylate cyclase, partial [Thermoleophilaceae bacterium]|nr:adenylate cyclase [Thermoleophilaceae bacterium]